MSEFGLKYRVGLILVGVGIIGMILLYAAMAHQGATSQSGQVSTESSQPAPSAQGQQTEPTNPPATEEPTAPAPQEASPMSEAEIQEHTRKYEREAVRSNLTCTSYFPLNDGRPSGMEVIKQGEQLRVAFYAVNGPNNIDPLWNETFSQNNDGMWASYNDAENITLILDFNDEGKKTLYALRITYYSSSGDRKHGDVTGVCEEAS